MQQRVMLSAGFVESVAELEIVAHAFFDCEAGNVVF
jgi:hypothetical protein